MLACLDVDYRPDHAVAAAIVVGDWTDDHPVSEHVATIAQVEPYVPGEFYRRELPCLLQVISQITSPLDGILIDGYVFLDAAKRPGLGKHLYDALAAPRPVIIGVAKTRFAGAPAEEVLRGSSRVPLLDTSIGIDPQAAARFVRQMHGEHRVPTLLRRADALCRTATSSAENPRPG